MTTPPTPADWYPDPENPAGLRYWDGTAWTEHRAPAPPPAEFTPAAPQSSLSDLAGAERPDTPEASTDPASGSPESGSHRAPDEQAATPTPVQPYDTHPPTSYQPPSQPATPESTPWNPPLPSWDTPSSEPSYAPPPTQAFEAAPYAPPPGATGYPSPGPTGDGPNKKLVIGILGGAAAILLAIVLTLVFVLIRKGDPTVTSSQRSTSSSAATTTTSSQSTSETSSESATSATPTPPPTSVEGSDGDYTFSVAGTETGDTVTSTVDHSVQTTANGMFYVVYLNVTNTGAGPLTFVATFQHLNVAGQAIPLDDEATAFLGGTIAQVAPGDKVETPLVYDVPTGAEPDSVVVRADPSTAGVELPLR